MDNVAHIQQAIFTWWDHHGRHSLPWHQDRSPYGVWVSEVMLQQTQVKTVIPYYKQFMAHLPSLQALALADLDTVLHLWSGLGYYSRARNLHKSATILLEKYGGTFPETVSEWAELPGVGRSTAGAIVAASFNQRAPILDGNVKRVLCRLAGIEGWPGHATITKQLWSLADEWTPDHKAAQWTQAVMDIGALICKRKPACDSCPLHSHCSAYRSHATQMIPAAKPAKHRPTKHLHFFILQNNGDIWLEQRNSSGIWKGLWTPPIAECIERPESTTIQGRSVKLQHSLPSFTHELSHFHLVIHPHIVKATQDHMRSLNNGIWYAAGRNLQIGLPAPVKRLIHQISEALVVCD